MALIKVASFLLLISRDTSDISLSLAPPRTTGNSKGLPSLETVLTGDFFLFFFLITHF